MTHPNDLAFPSETSQGMTKREYFAAKIYCAYVGSGYLGAGNPEKCRKWALTEADELIKALNKDTP